LIYVELYNDDVSLAGKNKTQLTQRPDRYRPKMEGKGLSLPPSTSETTETEFEVDEEWDKSKTYSRWVMAVFD
jgi:hypothetical protein